MDDTANATYHRGLGKEIDSEKMCALRSSSALTYNLFYNQTVSFGKCNHTVSRIGAGVILWSSKSNTTP